MTNFEQGFIKRAQEYGFSEVQASEILKQAEESNALQRMISQYKSPEVAAKAIGDAGWTSTFNPILRRGAYNTFDFNDWKNTGISNPVSGGINPGLQNIINSVKDYKRNLPSTEGYNPESFLKSLTPDMTNKLTAPFQGPNAIPRTLPGYINDVWKSITQNQGTINTGGAV